MIREGPVLDHDSLGLARRPRGIDHIGQVAGRHPARHVRPTVGPDCIPVGVQTNHVCYRLRHGPPQARLSQKHWSLGILDHEDQPFLRIRRIERHVGAAGLENAQDPNHHLQAALHVNPDPRLRPDSKRSQVVCQLIGSRVQLTVCQLLVFKDRRHGVGRAPHLRLKQLMNAGILGEVGCGVVPVDQNLTTRRLGQ